MLEAGKAEVAAFFWPLNIPCLVAVATGENQSEARQGFSHGIFLHFDHDPQEEKAHPMYQDLIAKARSLYEQVVIFELPQTLTVLIPASLLEPTPNLLRQWKKNQRDVEDRARLKQRHHARRSGDAGAHGMSITPTTAQKDCDRATGHR